LLTGDGKRALEIALSFGIIQSALDRLVATGLLFRQALR
jgi:hypothetical protein